MIQRGAARPTRARWEKGQIDGMAAAARAVSRLRDRIVAALERRSKRVAPVDAYRTAGDELRREEDAADDEEDDVHAPERRADSR